MKKLKDIRENLSKDIDIFSQYPQSEISVKEKLSKKENTSDILVDLADVSIKKKQELHIEKNKTRFFDSLAPKSFLFSETVDITKQNSFKKIFSNTSLPRFSGNWKFIVMIFLLVCFLGVLDKKFVENRVNSGYGRLLQTFTESRDIKSTQQNVNNARFDFLLSDIFFTPFKLLSTEKINNAYHAIKGGKMLTLSLDSVFEIYEKSLEFIESKDIESIYFTQMFQNLRGELLHIEDNLASTLRHYTSITTTGNTELDATLGNQIEKLEFLASRIGVLNDNFPTFLDILGHSKRKTYLIVFQNSDEIRPTGGFMGSMATVSLFRGQIKDFVPRDVYSFEWDLKRSDYQRVSPPKGINELTSSFGLRDANYYINLKDSSEAIRFFVEQSGQDIDGVIYINQSIIEELLTVTGPIYFKPLGREVTSENFSELMSLIVEAKLFKEGTQGTPKQILFDFINTFQSELFSQKKYGKYASVLVNHLQKREIMIYSFHSEENKLLNSIGFGGTINYSQTSDFAYPVFTSLSGNKSDRYMQRSYKKQVTFDNNCSINTSLQIISRHSFNTKKRQDMEKLMQEYGIDGVNTLDIQGQGDNYQFVRVLLPPKAKISPQKGMVVRDYGARTGVEFFLRTRPTETTTYRVDYFLDNQDCQTYTYAQYKQPGITNYDIEVSTGNKQDDFTGLTKDFFYSRSITK